MGKTKNILLIDETGVDGVAKKIIYVGCVINKNQTDDVINKIKKFNSSMLDNPMYSGSRSWVNATDEPRHFSSDHKTLREFFVDQVVSPVNCRIYACLVDYDIDKLLGNKILAMKRIISLVQSTKHINELEILAEESNKEFEREFSSVTFLSKGFLPLSIADYYAGMLGSFHKLRINLLNGEKIPQDEASFDRRFYENNVNKIAIEHDISEGIISSRRKGRVFLEEFKSRI